VRVCVCATGKGQVRETVTEAAE